ncbi:MAG: MotA/TolQ/ExbB proton channel family protein [Moraxellaceae bacterium]
MSIIKFIQEGGFFMYPILLVLFLGFGIVIERALYLAKVVSTNKSIWADVYPLITKGQLKPALDKVKGSDTAIGRILANGLTRSLNARRVEDVETAMEEGLMEVMPRLEARTSYVSTFANIATLLGLTGTVQGLISAFDAVANADPALKGDLLSGSISVAMNTTLFGLVVAIPLVLAYSYLQNKTNSVVESLEMASVKFLNALRQLSANKPE